MEKKELSKYCHTNAKEFWGTKERCQKLESVKYSYNYIKK